MYTPQKLTWNPKKWWFVVCRCFFFSKRVCWGSMLDLCHISTCFCQPSYQLYSEGFKQILRIGWHVLFLAGCSSPLCNEESVYNKNQTTWSFNWSFHRKVTYHLPTVPFEQIFQVAVMLREGDTSPTDIPKFFGARNEMEAPSANGGRTLSICVLVGSFSAKQQTKHHAK